MGKAIENGISVFRLLQEDVLLDRNNWQSYLIESLKHHINPTLIHYSPEYLELYKFLIE